MDDDEFRKKLKEVCMNYDVDEGKYPESDFEGRAVYESYCEENKLNCDTEGWDKERENRFNEKYEVRNGKWALKKEES